MVIKILGTGCPSCQQLGARTKEVLRELGVAAKVILVKDVPSILAYGVMATPALVINEKVRAIGIPSKGKIAAFVRGELFSEAQTVEKN